VFWASFSVIQHIQSMLFPVIQPILSIPISAIQHILLLLIATPMRGLVRQSGVRRIVKEQIPARAECGVGRDTYPSAHEMVVTVGERARQQNR
jgi:hypothetical protein